MTLQAGTTLGYDRDEDQSRGLKTVSIPGTDDYIVAVGRGTVL